VPQNLTQKLLASHHLGGRLVPGDEIALRVDQTLTQDATGTLVMLELEAIGIDRVKTEVSAQYVDHNIIQDDNKNPDDHLFLRSACQRFGIWWSRPGNGVSHPVHMARLAKPGKLLLGADSHTCASGAVAMLSIGTGGLEVAMAMAGEPYNVRTPRVFGVRLEGALPDWVSAKDIILEMLRRHGETGGRGAVLEYHGPGLAQLSAMDRHVIANMGAELGATATVFPSDEVTRRFFRQEAREQDWMALGPDDGCAYDQLDVIDLAKLEPLIALPPSPGAVVPVRDVAGAEIYQAYVGSSANPGYRDFAIAAAMVEGRQVPAGVSFDISPTSREILENLVANGVLWHLIRAGGRIHQAGCNGCIGMGQAPATDRNSLRTVPRNFPGRSGTKEDRVFLCSPETATASALMGRITDPRTLGMPYPRLQEPARWVVDADMLEPPPPLEVSRRVTLVRGPNIAALPMLAAVPDALDLPVLLKMGDGVSTDEILPAGARVLPYRSNIPAIARYAFETIDPGYPDRARAVGDHAVVAGENYGQGSSREHAVLAPRYLGLRAVIALSFARIHWQNLVNFGVLPLRFLRREDYEAVPAGARLRLTGIRGAITTRTPLVVEAPELGLRFAVTHDLSDRQIRVVLDGGLVNALRNRALVGA
jgi:aconitate hydratase